MSQFIYSSNDYYLTLLISNTELKREANENTMLCNAIVLCTRQTNIVFISENVYVQYS